MRLTNIKNTASQSLPAGLSLHEAIELKRLFFEVGCLIDEYAKNEKLTAIVTRLFHHRMNNGKSYSQDQVLSALGEMISWPMKK